MDKPKTYVSGGPPEQERQDNPSGVVFEGKRTDPETAHKRIEEMRKKLRGEK